MFKYAAVHVVGYVKNDGNFIHINALHAVW